jgi:DNA-binding GntR family transcriptional regulator
VAGSTESGARQSRFSQLAAELRRDILRGRYADGVKLPTEAELAVSHGVSRQTVRRAFHDLVAEGMVYRVAGRGTFARPRGEGYLVQFGSIEDLMGLPSDNQMEITVPLHPRVDVTTASRLRLSDDSVFQLEFRRRSADTAFVHTVATFPPHVGELLLTVPQLNDVGELTTETVIGLLHPLLENPVTETAQSITVASADEHVAESLGVEFGHPMLRIDRLYLDSEGQAVELAITHCVPESYSYRINLRRSV